ncbi:hypothetical protein AT730_04520 [Vibrio alginolyticus]|nr:hypothetical protein AT730_04520 [Vibrio alginolyticus]
MGSASRLDGLKTGENHGFAKSQVRGGSSVARSPPIPYMNTLQKAYPNFIIFFDFWVKFKRVNMLFNSY